MEIVEEDVPKLSKRYDPILLNVVLVKYMLNLLRRDGLARLSEGLLKVPRRNEAAVVSVKVFK